ncbi:hypothetical protein FACS1894116_11890 [Betaproteobacteria bacterium]|nr:hypothetical protein FACS1894116_11890 [Betaproteobacteria bacterium]GHU23248.1 hypothetical protein FACS189488_05420 [Betaproteobacteria bacterium]GHU28067.1 hypothetical protein FACS189497_02610 [Betaproteobacteria bacterium]
MHGLHGDNTRVDVCLEGVVQITISNIINGSICEGLYAWEIKDAFDHYGDNAQGRLGLSWDVLLSPFATDVDERKFIARQIVEKYPDALLVRFGFDAYVGGDIVAICNNLNWIA